MGITTAILEFVVIGMVWLPCLGLAFVILAVLFGSDPQTVASRVGAAFQSPMTVLYAYLLGVISQATAWRYRFRRLHVAALEKEFADVSRRKKYEAMHALLRRRPSLMMAGAEMKTAKDLERFLDLLRWEIYACERPELAKQYITQFHLYRLSYGVIPPSLALAVIALAGAIIAWARHLPSATVSGLVFLSIVMAAITCSAWVSTDHRRGRTLKYLMYGGDVLLRSAESVDDKVPASATHTDTHANVGRTA